MVSSKVIMPLCWYKNLIETLRKTLSKNALRHEKPVLRLVLQLQNLKAIALRTGQVAFWSLDMKS
jgi:predicted unusual protein kinase regulating ubiquinone biosynthesis (AarF/ABC1/UbiB family)